MTPEFVATSGTAYGYTGEAVPGESGALFERPQFRFVWYRESARHA
jgi:hypothetical protein